MKSARHSHMIRIFSAAMALLLVLVILPAPGAAVNAEGLVVERLTFRDILRTYSLNRGAFGADALEKDEYGVSNAAKRLAELFTFTVGLNYTGEGLNANYFGKDITAKMDKETYTESALQATYRVEIFPYRSYAQALPEGKTTEIRVYLVGYTNAASGVEPVLHYVWQDSGIWYAVKDDNPYYRVSYNGQSARQVTNSGLVLAHSRAASGGTEKLQSWTSLSDTPDGDGIVHVDGSTLVTGRGTVNVFGVTRDLDRLRTEGGFSTGLLAVSDFFRGDTTYQTGPLVHTREVYEADTMRRIADGETLEKGVTYRFRVVYDETLAVAAGAEWEDVGLRASSGTTDMSKSVSDFVWYGNTEFLTGNKYNPRAVEFTFTPSGAGDGVVTFVPENLAGSTSALKAAAFHALTETDTPPTPAPTAVPTPTAAPTKAPTAEPTAAPTAVPTAAPTPAPTAVITPAFTPKATLAVLFNKMDSEALTRGVLAQTLWILAGQPMGENEKLFSDQPQETDYAQAVLWASRTGIMPGSDGAFHVNGTVTREQAALILYRYARLRGTDTGVSGDLSVWKDGASVSEEARGAVIWALGRGIMSGRTDGGLHPLDTVLCGEAISMIATLQQGL